MQFLNLIICNGRVRDTDRTNLFPDKEIVHIVRPGNKVLKDILDCLVMLGVFRSKSQARKSWQGPVQFPDGWSNFERLGKHRKELYIWNPSES